jgi:hypothetical protein
LLLHRATDVFRKKASGGRIQSVDRREQGDQFRLNVNAILAIGPPTVAAAKNATDNE